MGRIKVTISVKLLMLVAAAVVATLASNLVAIYSGQAMEETGRQIYSKGLVGVQRASDLMITFTKQSALIRAIPTATADELSAATEEFARLSKDAGAILTHLGTTASGEDGNRIDVLASLFKTLSNEGGRAFAAALAGKPGEARALLEGSLADATFQIEALLGAYQSQATQGAQDQMMSLEKTSKRQNTVLIGLAVLLLAATGGGGMVLAGSIRRPLVEITQAVRRLATGDTSVEVPVLDRRDEIGDIARAVEIFKRDAIETAHLVEQVINSARQVALATGQASSAVGQVSDGAHAQLSALRRVAAAVKQSTAAIAEVSTSTQSASELSRATAEQVHEGRERMTEMAAVVRSTAENAKKIEKMAQSISAIADQTNMLALNAAIEAARAGEHGKGFAVVADEVRKLAEHSGGLASEIGELVRAATEGAQSAVTMVVEVNGKMEIIAESVRRNDTLTASVATSMEQQQATVEQISGSVDGLEHIAQSNAAAAEEITSTMVDLSRLAEQSKGQVERFAGAKSGSPSQQVPPAMPAPMPASA